MTTSELKEKRRLLSAEVRKLTKEIELKEKNIITEFPKYYKFVDALNLTDNKQYAYAEVTYYNDINKTYHCTTYRILNGILSSSTISTLYPDTIEEKYKEISLHEFTNAKNIIIDANNKINNEKSKLIDVINDITNLAKKELSML